MGQFESYQPENMLCKVVHFACCAFSGSFLGASFTWPLEERCYLKVSNFRPVGHISVFKTHKVHLLQNRPKVFFCFLYKYAESCSHHDAYCSYYTTFYTWCPCTVVAVWITPTNWRLHRCPHRTSCPASTVRICASRTLVTLVNPRVLAHTESMTAVKVRAVCSLRSLPPHYSLSLLLLFSSTQPKNPHYYTL